MTTVRLDAVYVPSEDIVAREIEGELIIVPLTAGFGDVEDDLFTLNETGQAVWRRLDGQTSLARVIADLAEEFEAPPGEIEAGVVALMEELVRRRIVVEAGDP